MGGKYEIRYYLYKDPTTNWSFETIYTNSWIEFIKLRLTKKIIYYKVCY
jgi:hypothetical protein